MRDKTFRGAALGAYSFSLILVMIPVLGVLTSEPIREIGKVEWHRLVQALSVSVSSSLVSMSVIGVIGLGSAYFMATYEWRGKCYIDQLLSMPLVLPPAVTGIILLITFGSQGIVGSYLAKWGIYFTFSIKAVVLVQIFVGLPIFVQNLVGHFKTVDSKLIESAKLEGCNEWQSFYYITLPLTKYGIASGFLMCFSRVLAEFGGTMLFAGNMAGKTQTLPLAIYSAMESNMGEALLIAIVLMAIAFSLMSLVNRLVRKMEG